ncbi:hypothetical protein [Pseudomonas helleri]|uniref:hypothetical protein n=1 Tax=Pseudomonas helleri TaxID=1608996 RepID=UPI003F98BD1D
MARPRKTTDQSATISVSLRIDPKVKYAIDLLAREQKRTITGVVEWAVMQAIRAHKMPGYVGNDDEALSLYDFLEMAWSPIEAHRIVALGTHKESLLTFEESCLYKVVQSIPELYEEFYSSEDPMYLETRVKYDLLGAYWPVIEQRAEQLMQTGNFLPVGFSEVVEHWKLSGELPK